MINKLKAYILVLGLVCSSIPPSVWAAVGDNRSGRNTGHGQPVTDHVSPLNDDLALDLGAGVQYDLHEIADLGREDIALTRTGPEGSIDFVLTPAAGTNSGDGRFAVHVLGAKNPDGSPSTSQDHSRQLAMRIATELQPVSRQLVGSSDAGGRRAVLDRLFTNADKSGDAGRDPAAPRVGAPEPDSAHLAPAIRDAAPHSLPPEPAASAASAPTSLLWELVHSAGALPKKILDAWEIYDQHRKLEAWQASPKKIFVAVNSLSYPHDPGLVGGEFYDMRPLAQILFAKDPNFHMVYVTAMPISESVKRHVLRGRADADEILKRVTFIALNDAGPENLAAKLVKPQHAGVVRRIHDEVARLRKETGALAASQFYMTDANAWKLTQAFGIPNAIFGYHPTLEGWTGKNGNRKLIRTVLERLKARERDSRAKARNRKVRVHMADGEEDIYDVDSMVKAIERVRARHPERGRVAIKLEQGTSGGGNVYRDISRWSDPDMSARDKHDVIETTLREFTIGISDPRSFLELMAHEGSVVEEFLDEFGLPGVTFPSCQADLAPDQSVDVVSTHEQILKDRNQYMGVEYLAKKEYRSVLRDVTQELGKELAKKGVVGRIAVDFAAVPRPDGTYDVYVIEINVRLGGTTHPLIAAKELTDAYYDGKGELRRADGKLPVRYRALDHDVRVNLKADVSRGLPGIGEEELLAFFDRPEHRGLLFDKKTRRGVVFHLLPAVRLSGNVGYTIIGTSDEEVARMQEKLTWALNELEIEHLTGRKNSHGIFVVGDYREEVLASGKLGESKLEKAFADFLSWNGDILYDRKTGKGVVFHPKGFTVVGPREEIPELGRRAERLMHSFVSELYRYEQEIAAKAAKLKPNQKLYRSSHGRGQTLAVLENSRKRMGLPPIETKVIEEKTDPKRRTIAFATLVSVWKVAIAEEVDRQSPEDYFLVLDPSDIYIETEPDGFRQPYLTQGLHVAKDGKMTIMKFKHPRPIDYGGNWLTLAAFGRDDGIPLEANDIPWSSSIGLEKRAGDKAYTRGLIDEGVPQSVLFMMPKNQLMAADALPHEPKLMQRTPMSADRAVVYDTVKRFLDRYHGARVVVKPVAGMRFHSGEGVDFFDRTEVDRITDHIVMLSKHPKMEEAGGILLDQCVDTIPVWFDFKPYSGKGDFAYWHGGYHEAQILTKEQIAANPKTKKDYNARFYVSEDDHGKIEAVEGFVRIGGWAKPTNVQTVDPADSAAVIPFSMLKEALMKQQGFSGEEVDRAFAKMQQLAENGYRKIREDEKRHPLPKNGPSKAQTNYLSFDFMVERNPRTGEIDVLFIEINDHDSGGQWLSDLFNLIQDPSKVGEHTRAWAGVMRRRADENVARRLARQP